MKNYLSAVAAGLGLLGAAPAVASVMTFDALATDNAPFWGQPVGPDVREDGFVIRSCSGRCGTDNLMVFNRNDPKQADTGGATVAVNFNDLTLTLEREDGAAFDFYSIDLADFYNLHSFGPYVRFDFIRPTGTNSVFAGVTVPVGLQRFVFDEAGVASVKFQGAGMGGIGQFDNITLNERAVSVPEPGSLALLLTGLMGAAVARRSRPRSAALSLSGLGLRPPPLVAQGRQVIPLQRRQQG